MSIVLMHKRPLYKEQSFVSGMGFIDFSTNTSPTDPEPTAATPYTRTITNSANDSWVFFNSMTSGLTDASNTFSTAKIFYTEDGVKRLYSSMNCATPFWNSTAVPIKQGSGLSWSSYRPYANNTYQPYKGETYQYRQFKMDDSSHIGFMTDYFEPGTLINSNSYTSATIGQSFKSVDYDCWLYVGFAHYGIMFTNSKVPADETNLSKYRWCNVSSWGPSTIDFSNTETTSGATYYKMTKDSTFKTAIMSSYSMDGQVESSAHCSKSITSGFFIPLKAGQTFALAASYGAKKKSYMPHDLNYILYKMDDEPVQWIDFDNVIQAPIYKLTTTAINSTSCRFDYTASDNCWVWIGIQGYGTNNIEQWYLNYNDNTSRTLMTGHYSTYGSNSNNPSYNIRSTSKDIRYGRFIPLKAGQKITFYATNKAATVNATDWTSSGIPRFAVYGMK